jgi:hypothetical protein
MSEIDFPNRLHRYGATNFTITRIALTTDDRAGLPSFPAKDKIKDSRYKWFVKNYGDRCWEIDAMDPSDLRNRVESEILKYIDPVAWNRHTIIEEAQRETTRMIASQMRDMQHAADDVEGV